MKDLVNMIWDNSQTFDEFKSNVEKQGYRITAEHYLRNKFNKEKNVNVLGAVEYVPAYPTVRDLRSAV